MTDQEDIDRLGAAALPIQLGRIADSMERLETHMRIFLECMMVSNGFTDIDRLPQGDMERGLLYQMARREEGMKANRNKKQRYREKGRKQNE